jgi:toxin ParE1/3/4
VDIRFTPTARKQFLDEVARILEASESAASTFITNTEIALDGLRGFPDSGQPLAEIPARHYRQVVVAAHRFFYRRKADIIWIIGVWHHRQDADIPGEKGR